MATGQGHVADLAGAARRRVSARWIGQVRKSKIFIENPHFAVPMDPEKGVIFVSH